MLSQVENYVGTYFSKEWVKKNVLHLTDDEIGEMQKQMDGEGDDNEEDGDNNFEQKGDGNEPRKNDGSNAKHAESDAFKRCAMKLGLGLHLWAGEEYYLDKQLDRKGLKRESKLQSA